MFTQLVMLVFGIIVGVISIITGDFDLSIMSSIWIVGSILAGEIRRNK